MATNLGEGKLRTQTCLTPLRSWICVDCLLEAMLLYHTITDIYTTALLLTKPSSDDDSGFRHGFGAKASYIYIYIYIYIYKRWPSNKSAEYCLRCYQQEEQSVFVLFSMKSTMKTPFVF